MAKPDVKTLFCASFQCPPAEYEARAFRMCLPWYARWLAPLVRQVNPDCFAEDFKFLRYLGAATGVREANADMLAYQEANRAKPSFLRTDLRIRVSGRKGFGLAQKLLSAARPHD